MTEILDGPSNASFNAFDASSLPFNACDDTAHKFLNSFHD